MFRPRRDELPSPSKSDWRKARLKAGPLVQTASGTYFVSALGPIRQARGLAEKCSIQLLMSNRCKVLPEFSRSTRTDLRPPTRLSKASRTALKYSSSTFANPATRSEAHPSDIQAPSKVASCQSDSVKTSSSAAGALFRATQSPGWISSSNFHSNIGTPATGTRQRTG